MNDIHHLDLNLLVAFDTLARTQHVTRAAAQMGVTQSAMSHTLRRLRALLGDPLLVRGRGGMQLTPRAEALIPPIRAGLRTLHHAITEPTVFDPKTATRTFRIASPDLFDALVVPRLMATLRQEAPGARLVVSAVREGLGPALETGDLDLAVVPLLPGAPEGPVGELQRRTLFRDAFCCFLRADHPALARFDRERFAALPHLLVSPDGGGTGPVDRALEAHGLTRQIALRLPHFQTAPAVVATTDLVLTAPAALARLTTHLPIAVVAPPLPIPQHGIAMLWHRRFGAEPAHAWLRSFIADAAISAAG